LEDFIHHLQSLDPLLVYVAVFLISFVENVFPPFPSDVVVAFAGSLVGLGRVGFLETLLSATLGSALGFVLMYKIGGWFGNRILEQGKIKFIPVEAVAKVEEWFRRYGYGIIIANRFMAGTRAVISFFAGLSDLNLIKTTALSFVSALAWNTVLVFAGYNVGQNWQKIGFYLNTYSHVATAIVVVVILVFVIRYFYSRNNGAKGR
jgi:membrane protein DedA with SNARE-associated domain